VLDRNLAFVCPYAEYFWPQLPCYHRPVRGIRRLLVHIDTVLVAATGEVQDPVPHSLPLVRHRNVGMDDLGSDDC